MVAYFIVPFEGIYIEYKLKHWSPLEFRLGYGGSALFRLLLVFLVLVLVVVVVTPSAFVAVVVTSGARLIVVVVAVAVQFIAVTSATP